MPVQLPIGKEAGFNGVVDLLNKQAYVGVEGKKADVPADMADAVEEAHIELMDVAAESDDELLERYLETMELTPAEVGRGFRAAVRNAAVVPCLLHRRHPQHRCPLAHDAADRDCPLFPERRRDRCPGYPRRANCAQA